MMQQRKSRSAGAAMVELAIVLPVLALLILGGVEFSLYIITRAKAHTISRDIAIDVFKRCEGLNDGTETTTCIQAQTDAFYAKVPAELTNRHLILVQVFRATSNLYATTAPLYPYVSANPCPVRATYQRVSSPPLGVTPPSRVVTPAGSPLAEMCAGLGGAFDPSQEVIASVEIFYRYDPIFGFIGSLFGFDAGVKYVASVV